VRAAPRGAALLMTLLLLTGGARSGKSRLALRLASARPDPVVFIATGEAGDLEMEQRIARHRCERPASWETIEEPLLLHEAILRAGDGCCVIVDCLTLWTANSLRAYGAAETEAKAAAAAAAAAARRGLTIAVSNEVGAGVVPRVPLARAYRDLLGRVNATWAEAADQVFLLLAGRALRLARVEELFEELG
jgi:adenosyl cobinamide kinase/adenosyl cobinamide phosphate guanylyltransferase